jgi:hypothetical protein
VGFVVTVSSEGSRSGALYGAASEIVYGLLSNPSKRRRHFEARGASPLMRERRNLTESIITYLTRTGKPVER